MRMRVVVPEAHVHPDVLNSVSEAVTRLDERLIAEGRVPLAKDAISRGAVRWRPEPPGEERFDHAGIVLQRGWGDCDDLAPWHAASLRASGEDPGARAVVVRSGPKKFHDLVQRSDGTVDDPSVWAGMPTVSGISPPTVAPMFDMRQGRPAVALVRSQVDGCWHARADIPWRTTGYALSSGAFHRDPLVALRRSIHGACAVGDASGACGAEPLAQLVAVEGRARGRWQHVRGYLRRVCGVELSPERERSACVVGDALRQAAGF